MDRGQTIPIQDTTGSRPYSGQARVRLSTLTPAAARAGKPAFQHPDDMAGARSPAPPSRTCALPKSKRDDSAPGHHRGSCSVALGGLRRLHCCSRRAPAQSVTFGPGRSRRSTRLRFRRSGSTVDRRCVGLQARPLACERAESSCDRHVRNRYVQRPGRAEQARLPGRCYG